MPNKLRKRRFILFKTNVSLGRDASKCLTAFLKLGNMQICMRGDLKLTLRYGNCCLVLYYENTKKLPSRASWRPFILFIFYRKDSYRNWFLMI